MSSNFDVRECLQLHTTQPHIVDDVNMTGSLNVLGALFVILLVISGNVERSLWYGFFVYRC